jgi:hypothetical protein
MKLVSILQVQVQVQLLSIICIHDYIIAGFRPSAHVTSPARRLTVDHRCRIPFHQLSPQRRIVCRQRLQQENAAKLLTEASDGTSEPEVIIQIEDLTMSQISELIEVSFIQACMVQDTYLPGVISRRLRNTKNYIH